MIEVSLQELIDKATSVIHAQKINEFMIGDVGSALVTDKGNIYTGVALDAPSGMGFCAETNAIAAMVTAGETKIQRIVAVWKDGDEVYVVSPCGKCRQFISFIDSENIHTHVVLSKDKSLELQELLPHYNEYIKV